MSNPSPSFLAYVSSGAALLGSLLASWVSRRALCRHYCKARQAIRLGVSTLSSTAVLPESCLTQQRCCRSAFYLRSLLFMSLHRCLPPRVWLLAGSCVALLFLVFGLSGGGLFPSQLPSRHHDILDDISNATLGVCFPSATANSKSFHLHDPFKVSEDLRYRLARAHRSQRFYVAGCGINRPQHRICRRSYLSGQQDPPAWRCRERA
jgi:hypothetical protein